MALTRGSLSPPTPTYQPTWAMRSATEADLRWIVPRLTHASLTEIEAVSKFQPISFLFKDMTRKGVIIDVGQPNKPVAVFDVTRDQEWSSFWAAMTEDLPGSQSFWSFSEYTRAILNNLNNQHPTLSSYVDARNDTQISWLERVGFVHVDEVPKYGRKQLPFKLYRRVNGQTV